MADAIGYACITIFLGRASKIKRRTNEEANDQLTPYDEPID